MIVWNVACSNMSATTSPISPAAPSPVFLAAKPLFSLAVISPFSTAATFLSSLTATTSSSPALSPSTSPPSGVVDLENQTTTVTQRSILPPKKLSTPTGQACFACFDSPENRQYAVLVPCVRPTTKEDGTRYNVACESDSRIWRRLVETCYEHKGKWKKWVPFYGIIEVREVTFQFLGVVDAGRRYPICMMPVDLASVERQCRKQVDKFLRYYDPDDPSYMCTPIWHVRECPVSNDISQPCIYELAEAARQRLKRIPFRYILRDCALRPEIARGLDSLEDGVEQESCIYNFVRRTLTYNRFWASTTRTSAYEVRPLVYDSYL
ncbi:hypothetical protein F5Y12DRAFT_780570 [Xylaria sp. FL1777]|nr:hypothetical protein F5Y12DRAFT_780570 [Xylaria sp. FL1777]